MKYQLPPIGRYVLIHMKSPPWRASDMEGVLWRVAARQRCQPTANNPNDWCWDEFGPSSHWPGEVDRWLELPR